jgi:hypothetical protein
MDTDTKLFLLSGSDFLNRFEYGSGSEFNKFSVPNPTFKYEISFL